MLFAETNTGYRVPKLALIMELHQWIVELQNSTSMIELHNSFMKLHKA